MNRQDIKDLEQALYALAQDDYREFLRMTSSITARVIEEQSYCLHKKQNALEDLVRGLTASGKKLRDYRFISQIEAMKQVFPDAKYKMHSEAERKSFEEFKKHYFEYKARHGDLSSWAKAMGHFDFFQALENV